MNILTKSRSKNIIVSAVLIALIALLSFAVIPVFGESAKDNGGSAKAAEKSFFTVVENAELVEHYNAPDYVGDYEGVFVKALDNGDSTVRLSHELDLRGFTDKDPIVKFVIIPTKPIEKREQLQTDSITVTLTDVEDENNFVEIELNANADATYPWASYMGARGNGQFLSSYRQTTNTFGRGCYKDILTNFYARPAHNQPNSDVTIKYDYVNKVVHAEPIAVSPWLGTKVADLSHSDVMGGRWSGFKSGRVWLTITGGSSFINNKDSGFLITQIGNFDLSADSWEDNEAPRLKVDTFGYDDRELPEGKMFMKYPVYPAEAYDMFDSCYGETKGEKNVSVTVERVAGGNVTEIPVADGYIVPADMGAYRIRYATEDAAGHKSEKTLNFYVRDAFGHIGHEWSETLSESGFVGERVEIPTDTVFNASGKYRKTYEVFEVASNKRLDIIDSGFTPVVTGAHLIRVNITDFLGQTATFDYTVGIKAKKLPVVFGAPSFPPALYVGKTTTLTDFEAYDYYSVAGMRVDAVKTYAIYGSDNSLLAEIKPEEEFVPEVSWGASVKIECTVKSVLYSDSLVFAKESVAVINRSETHSLGDYFLKTAITSTQYNFSSGRNVTFLFSSDNARLEFCNPLMLSGMSLAVRVPKNYGNYGKINVTLTDYANADKSVMLTIEKPTAASSNTGLFSVNGGENKNIRGTFDGSLLDDFVINIDAKFNIYDVAGNALGSIGKYLSGAAFEGFTDNLCYVTFSFENVSGNGALSVVMLGNTYFSDSTTDFIGPMIELTSTLAIEQYVGKITLPGAVASDVQYGKTGTRLLVTSPDGRTVYNGTADLNQIELDAAVNGSYSVTYSARDDRGNNEVAVYTVYVYKKTMPEVSLVFQMPASGKVGEKLVLPGVRFDGEVKDISMYAYVINPDGGITDIDKTFSFVPERAGVYEVVYYIVDDAASSYNYKLIKNRITVE